MANDHKAILPKTNQYQILVEGELSDSWSDWLGDVILEVEDETPGSSISRISGALLDQAALRGLLTKLWDLNLRLISVTIHEDESIGGTNEY